MPTSTDDDLAVQVRTLVKSYGGRRAVDGVDLDVRRGEVFALLGPNGAGKTTTVEILEGYRRRDSGEVLVLGHDPGTPTAQWRSRVGIVLQSTGGHDELTVAELVRAFAGYYPQPRDPDDVIAAVGLTEQAGTRTRRLSGGQRRRLDVALGILGHPDLLFLDEPTTGFDPAARRDFWGLIRQLAAEGTTIMLTTHYLEEAEQLADRVAVLAGGRIVATGTPEDLNGRQRRVATVQWEADGVVRNEQTDTPTALVAQLAATFDGEVPGLAVIRPTLEDIYLDLVKNADHDPAETLR
jgi:ABC-2 type transport system ATP-binding protein